MAQKRHHVVSKTLFERASRVIPGGVNSPVRAFRSVGGSPVFMASAKGAYLYDVDGNRYIDLINSWGPMILGHRFEPVIEAVSDQLNRAMSFGAPTDLEVEMAELIISMVPNMDQVRLVSSGTEACMSAIRLARGATGREKILKFEGHYHGHADSFLISAGSGALTAGKPDSKGVTAGVAKDTLTARYNDLQSVSDLIDANPVQIACIIVEPVAGNMGCVPPATGFLEGLRTLCDNNGIILIFDEVMTGFRLARGGAQEKFHVRADICTYGKVIGAGMPVGAFAARSDIMEHLAPLGGVYQAGTLSGNPLAVSAGLAQLKWLNEHPKVYDTLESKGALLELLVTDKLNRIGIPYKINRVGSMFSLHFTGESVVDLQSAKKTDAARFAAMFQNALDRGVYLPPSAYESWFLSNALEQSDIEHTVNSLIF